MPNPNSDHLFEQAERLAVTDGRGAPRQADLRRAFSTAYYGLFHFTVGSLADEFSGAGQRGTPRYALLYRAINHRSLANLAAEVAKVVPSDRYKPFVSASSLGPEIRAFARTVKALQEKRYDADYNPLARFQASKALLDVSTARAAVNSFRSAPEGDRKLFLTLLLCPPR